MRITEEFNPEIELPSSKQKVNIYHEGIKKFENQEKGSYEILINAITEDLLKGKTKGFIPYNNFECSVTWKTI